MTRIISTMLSRNYLYDVTKNMSNVQTLQNQLSTGKEISKPSDDPYKASRIISMYADIGANEQYNNNITDVSNFLDVTDTALGQMRNLLSRVRELLVASGNAAYGSEQLKSIQDEMSVKVDQLAQILNTNFDGKYVFGGTKVDSKPVTVVDGKLQYADDSGKAILVYKDANGKYTTSETGANKAVNLTDLVDDNTMNVRTKLRNELDNLDNKVAQGETLTAEEQNRKGELDSILNPSGGVAAPQVYKDINGKYTTSATGKTETINIKDVNSEQIKAANACVSNEEKDKILDGIKYYNQLSADMKLEISQGVIVNYNKTATEILEFTDTKTGTKVNVSDLFNDIIDNLNSVNSEDAKRKLTGDNLKQLDMVITNVLSKTSEVGALQNRMESAKKQNESDNTNLTTILSNVEDIDFTKKMIDFSTLMTVYKASLQISANILPKTIMDYL